eukprot:maker-scaffold_20-snap-gene-5.9-mRNA-1 protein AED:0.29 eAED:0.29 QI:22/1/1/1/0/0/2/47/273
MQDGTGVTTEKFKDYAARLSFNPNKGRCGLKEIEETNSSVKRKVKILAEMLRSSDNTVFITGAGISTAAGIPDFRGPNGVWTLEAKNKKRKRSESLPKLNSFNFAKPTKSHMILCKLEKLGFVDLLVSQNVDGLHLASGFPEEKLLELHGNIFAEECKKCSKMFYNSFDVGGIGLKPTGKKCPICGFNLVDTVLDWDSPINEDMLEIAEVSCEQADLVVCLGSSLRIYPVNSFPLMAREFVVINLQRTQIHKDANLVIHGKLDDVLAELMKVL